MKPLKFFKKRCGITLIELMVVLILGSLAIFSVSSIVIESYKEWKRSKDVVSLQVDLDLASHMIKSILEEADDVSVDETGNHIIASNHSYWIQEFYPDPANPNILIWRNSKTGETQQVITTLKSISFTEENNLVTVTLEVQKGTKIMSNSFSVFMRN